MQHRIRNFTLAILAVLALSPGLFAQTTRPSGGTTAQPDLSGIWQEEINPRAVPPGVFTKEEPPMLPWAIEKSRIRSRGTRQEVDDPSFYPYCMRRTRLGLFTSPSDFTKPIHRLTSLPTRLSPTGFIRNADSSRLQRSA